jgi:hypothetical protein
MTHAVAIPVSRGASRNTLRRAAGTLAGAALLLCGLPVLPYPFTELADAQRALSTFDEICLIKDREASAGLAQVLVNSATGAEQPLDEALVRLRRARMNCRRGWVEVARVDYDALRKAFPVDPQLVQLFAGGEEPLAALPAAPPQ